MPYIRRQWRHRDPPVCTKAGATAKPPTDVANAVTRAAADDERPLQKYQALVLDSAYQPIRVIPWKRAVCMEYQKKVAAVVEHNAELDQTVEILVYSICAV